MARQIVAEFLMNPGDLDVVWPDKTVATNGDTQSHGPDGIKDPKMQRELWGAAGELLRVDMQKGVRNPRDISAVREILGKSGFELAEQAVESSAA